MPYPDQVSLKRPCPDCGGKLSRKTEDPTKPLGMVVCSGCQFKSPIDAYVKSIQAEFVAWASQKKQEAQG